VVAVQYNTGEVDVLIATRGLAAKTKFALCTCEHIASTAHPRKHTWQLPLQAYVNGQGVIDEDQALQELHQCDEGHCLLAGKSPAVARHGGSGVRKYRTATSRSFGGEKELNV
jgi:hypothetical protein